MSTPPLNRDQQIEIMVNAAARHAEVSARLMQNAQVQAVVTAKPSDPKRYVHEQSKHPIARCA